LAVILIVAALTVHIPYGFSSIKLQAVTAAGPQFGPPGYETDLLYLAALATLVLGGTGPFALDQLLERNRSDPKNSGANAIEALLLEPAHRRQGGGRCLVALAQRLRDHESDDATGRKTHGQSTQPANSPE
jgi:putative oxidoreductase